jgi:hypothetical protein
MSNAARSKPVQRGNIIDLAAFRERCAQRAQQYHAGEIDLHDAVDGLQAIAGPIIDSDGQDAVQAEMAAAFRDPPDWSSPPTPVPTIHALLFLLRRGVGCLFDPGVRNLLRRIDRDGIREICAEILAWPGETADGRPKHWLASWPKDDVLRLVAAWHSARGADT